MSHWYLRGKDNRAELFDENHPMWGQLEGWPRNKNGTPKKRINDWIRLQLGLAPSVTTILKHVGDSAGLMNWYGDIGIQAGREAERRGWGDEGAKGHFKTLRDAASDRGTKFHKAIEEHLVHGAVSDDPAMQTACREIDRLGIAGEPESSWVWILPALDLTFAGTVDLYSKAARTITDFKTTTSERKPYEHEVAQIAAYAMGLFHDYHGVTARNVYISQQTGRVYAVKEWTSAQLDWGWNYFLIAYRAFDHSLKWTGLK